MPNIGDRKTEFDGVQCAVFEWGTAYQTGYNATFGISPEELATPGWWNLGSAGCQECADFNGNILNNCGNPEQNGSGTGEGNSGNFFTKYFYGSGGTGTGSRNSSGLFAGGLFSWLGLGLVGDGIGKPPAPTPGDWFLVGLAIIVLILIIKK